MPGDWLRVVLVFAHNRVAQKYVIFVLLKILKSIIKIYLCSKMSLRRKKQFNRLE